MLNFLKHSFYTVGTEPQSVCNLAEVTQEEQEGNQNWTQFSQESLGCPMRHPFSRVTASSVCTFGMYLWLWIAYLLMCKNKYNLENLFCWYKEFIIYVKPDEIWKTCLLPLKGTPK